MICSSRWVIESLLIDSVCDGNQNKKKKMEKYELVKDIGSGNFGVARLMRHKDTKELVAMKYIERGHKVGCFYSSLSSSLFAHFSLILFIHFPVFTFTIINNPKDRIKLLENTCFIPFSLVFFFVCICLCLWTYQYSAVVVVFFL